MLIYIWDTYKELLAIILLAIGVCCFLLGLSYCLSDSNLYIDKVSGYECGFDPFSNARDPFNIKFYLVSLLFIIFDIEIIFFFPWIFALEHITIVGFFSMYLFFLILIVGFVYEYRKRALDWGE